MLMSDVVDWLIPDIPKDISVQIHKEKILMVELFMKEEEGKMQNSESMAMRADKDNCNNHSPVARSESSPNSHGSVY